MDYSRLNKEYELFWKSHDYNKALSTIQNLKNFFGSDFSFYSNEQILKPEYLVKNYYLTTGKDISDVVQSVSYSDLLLNLSNYFRSLIKKITDNRKQLEAMQQVSVFEKLISSIADVLGIISNPVFLIALFGLFLLYFFKRK